MDLLKILQKKSKDFIKNQKAESKVRKANEEEIDKQEKNDERIFKLMETSGYSELSNKIRKKFMNEGMSSLEALKKFRELYGTFDPNKNYHEKKSRMKTKIVDNSKAMEKRRRIDKFIEEEEPILKKNTSKFIDNIIKGIEEKIPKKQKKTTMMTAKIMKPVKKRTMSTTKIVEYKPKEHELNKVIDLLEKMNQTKEIMNAIKYVKNFIKNN
jgi:uncharacterized protein YoaH (UPF0181 family)